MRAANHCGILCISAVVLLIWGLGQAAAQDGEFALIETVGKDGGVLRTWNERGDGIELTIPAGALTEEIEISLRPLSTPPTEVIAAHIFPGVELLPDGLSLLVPATLRVTPAVPVADPNTVLLYHVWSEDFVVPLDGPSTSEPEKDNGEGIVGYLDHFSTYGGGQPTQTEAQAQAELAYEMIPPYDPYGYQAFEEALNILLKWEMATIKLGGDDPYANKIEEAVLSHLKDFLAEPQPEPPCDPDYIQAALAYFRIMNLFGLPVYDDPTKNAEVAAVRAQMTNLFQEVADRCLSQLNLYINIDVIWGESIEKNYRGVINLGWQIMGDDSRYVYGTGELPATGSGQYGAATTEFDGVWYVVAEGSVVMATDQAGVMTDLVLELTLSGEVLEEVVSCIPSGCISAISSYHYEKPLSLSLRNATNTVVTMETFEGGMAITTTTLERVEAPLEQ